jgi:DNA-binding IclR family transcriptional regulator
MSYRVQSVERGIELLLSLTAGPQTVTDIARNTGLAKGTAFRLLASLGHHQFVVREPGGSRYMLGPGLLPLVKEIKSTFGWIGALAGQVLRELCEWTGETVIVHVRIGAERVCVEELPSPHLLRYTADVGSTAPIYIGSAGKVLLASMDVAELDRLLAQVDLVALTDASITDREELLREVERARERGWATSAGERVEGAAALSVPIRRAGGVVAALSVLGPAERFTAEKQEAYLPMVQRTAAAIERVASNAGGR